MFHKQQYHVLALAVLLLLLVASTWVPGMIDGELWGIETQVWFYATIGVAVLHQVYVWLCWRLQLHYRSLTERFGEAAFPIYAVGAVTLLVCRPVLVVLLGMANQDTFELPRWIAWSLNTGITVLCGWVLYSVVRYFSFTRMLGGDHFFEEIRERGLVDQGIFQYVSHPMYTVGMLGMWIPGIVFRSQAALLLAMFQHVYIWVHYWTVERPDLRMLYDTSVKRNEGMEPGETDSAVGLR